MIEIRIIGPGVTGRQLGDVYTASEHEAQAFIRQGSAEVVAPAPKKTPAKRAAAK